MGLDTELSSNWFFSSYNLALLGLALQFNFSNDILNGNYLLPEFYFLPFFNPPPGEAFPNPYLGNTLSHRWGLDLCFPKYPAIFTLLFLNFYLLVRLWVHISSSRPSFVELVLPFTC